MELFGYKKDHFSTSSGYILLRENELFEQPDMSVQVSITPRGNPEPFEKVQVYTPHTLAKYKNGSNITHTASSILLQIRSASVVPGRIR